jgi:hypothetical protein
MTDESTPVALRKARSLLLILLATCRESMLALEAAANELDTDLTRVLAEMIERTEHEVRVINSKLGGEGHS